MKTVLVIGMGRFGKHLSKSLIEQGDEVMIIDRDEENIRDLLPIATNAQIGDCTKEEVLRSLGVTNFDACFVCVGADFQSSLEITALLKDLGARRVISRASSDIHEKFLVRIGADEVVYPEKDLARKLAVRYSSDRVFDYIGLTKEVSIYEIEPLKMWIGKSIKELAFSTRYGMSILASKRGEKIYPLPGPNYIFKEDDHIMVMGRNEDISKLLRKVQ